jgi:hypothetical protein
MSKEFIKAALIRAIKTICQSAVAMIPVGLMITEVDWLTVLGTSLLAGVLSILTSIANGLPEVDE